MPEFLCQKSKHQFQLREQRIQRLARIDHVRLAKVADVRRTVARAVSENVSKAPTCLQRRGAKCNRNIVYQERTVCDPETIVEADIVANVILKKNVLQRLRTMKWKVVDIENCLDSLREFHIHPGVVDEYPGVHKIRLALRFAAAQTRQHTVGLHQSNSCLC